MRLVHAKTGETVKSGDLVKDFRGKESVINHWTEPHKPESSGRVHVLADGLLGALGGTQSYYPEVYGLKFVEGS